MFSPNQVWVTVDGKEKDRVRCSDSHEAQDAAQRLAEAWPRGTVFVQFDGGQPEIWEDLF